MLPIALLSACSEYTIETTLNPDGSGLRVERIEASENSDVKLAPEDFPPLMHATAGEGWSHEETTDDEGEPVHVFTRSTRIRNLPDWSSLNGTVRISGVLPSSADRTLGYVRLGDVGFYNQLHLSMSADSDGSTSFTYRETFTWDRAVDAVVEFLMSELDTGLASRFPQLQADERGQIVGFARARFWVAVEGGLLSEDGDDDRLLEEVVDRTLEQGIKVIRMRYPEAEDADLEAVLRESLVDSEDGLVGFMEQDLPGLNLAFNSEITFRLKLPGRVTRSNAHRREDGVLIWEFGPGDALEGPIEIFAEAQMEAGPAPVAPGLPPPPFS